MVNGGISIPLGRGWIMEVNIFNWVDGGLVEGG